MNSGCANPEFKLVAGSTWVFASADMWSLVDIWLSMKPAKCRWLTRVLSAHNLPLVGPCSCPVTQASHPGGGGLRPKSIMPGHVTMPDDREFSSKRAGACTLTCAGLF